MSPEDQEILTNIVTTAVRSALMPLPVPETKPAPESITYENLFEFMVQWRKDKKNLEKVHARFRDHANTSKTAARAIKNAIDAVQESEKRFVLICRGIAQGTMTVFN